MEVYGTFRVEDQKGTLDFFNEPSMDIESFKAKDTLPLSKTSRMILAAGTIIFHLDLRDKHDKEYIKGSFTLNLMDDKTTVSEIFDNYLVALIKGKQGLAMVYYTIPTMALESVITIQLIKGDNGTGHSNVNGRIVAHYGKNYDKSVDEDVKKYSWFMLYDKSSKETQFQLKDEDFLPLLRSSVAVPAQTSIVINMNLKFHHSNGHLEQLQDFEIQSPVCMYNSLQKEIVLDRAILKVMAYFVPEFISI